MQVTHTDILIKNKTTWLAHSLIMRTLDITERYMENCRSKYKAATPPSYHKRDTLPDNGKAWRWAKMNGQFYYAYNNIPDKAPASYKRSLPTEQQLKDLATGTVTTATVNQFEEHLKPFLNDTYKAYLSAYGDCTKIQQTNLAKAAAILEGVIEYIRTYNINTSKSGIYIQLSQFVQKHDLKYLGEAPRVIQRKIVPVLEEGKGITDMIRLPRADNDNASGEWNDEEIKSWIIQLRTLPGLNYTNAFIIRKIQQLCELTLKPCPADRWISTRMQERNIQYLTARERFGEKGRLAKAMRSYQPFKNAIFAGDCWQVDGSRVNIIPHKHIAADGSKSAAYLYTIVVRDVHSGMIIGRSYCINEDHNAVISAVNEAIVNTGYLPYEIIFDKFPGYNSEAGSNYLQNLEDWGVITLVSSNPDVKAGIERWFGTVQTVFMQESKYYYGQGITSRRTYNHRSEAYITKAKREAWKAGFSFDDAVAEADAIIDAYNSTVYSAWSRKHAKVQHSPAHLHQISEKPSVRLLEAQDIHYITSLQKELQIDGQGLIKTQINSADYYFRCTDPYVYSQHAKVLAVYDLNDLSQVYLYTIAKQGTMRQYLGTAINEEAAIRDGPNAQWGLIADRAAARKQAEEFRIQEQEYRKAVGDDITTLLAPMSVSKREAQQAESNYLNNQGKNSPPSFKEGPGVVTSHYADDDGEDLDFNPRNQY